MLGPFEPGYEAGVRAADQALAERPTAIVAYNDLVALGVVARLADRGVAVPRDVSVIGFDDIQMAAMASPPLTTVASAPTAAGRRGGRPAARAAARRRAAAARCAR